MYTTRLSGLIALALCQITCAGSKPTLVAKTTSNCKRELTAPPDWVWGRLIEDEEVCGIGVTGNGMFCEGPEEEAKRRAHGDLALMLRGLVEEAVIVHEEGSGVADSFFRQIISADPAVLEYVEEKAEVEHWLDVNGDGPFPAKNRMWARACVPLPRGMKIDQDRLAKLGLGEPAERDELPPWAKLVGPHGGARGCASVYLAPTYHAEDAREGLAEALRGYFVKRCDESFDFEGTEQRTVCGEGQTCADQHRRAGGGWCKGTLREVSLMALFYDADGIGPEKRKRSSYGFGCVITKR